MVEGGPWSGDLRCPDCMEEETQQGEADVAETTLSVKGAVLQKFNEGQREKVIGGSEPEVLKEEQYQ